MSSQRSKKKKRENKKVQQQRLRNARRTRPDEKPCRTASLKRSSPDSLEGLAQKMCVAEALTAIEILSEGRTTAKIMELWENAIMWARSFRQKSPVKDRHECASGCSFCCHIPVAISVPEALGLVVYLKDRFSPRALLIVREKIAKNAAIVGGMTTNEHARANVKCALLDDDGKCSAYEARPIPCSSWCSLSRSQYEAAFAVDPVTAKVGIDAMVHTTGRGVQAGLCVGVGQSGLDGNTYELHSALLRALDTPDAEQRWARGEDVFGGCKVTVERPRSVLSLPVLRQ